MGLGSGCRKVYRFGFWVQESRWVWVLGAVKQFCLGSRCRKVVEQIHYCTQNSKPTTTAPRIQSKTQHYTTKNSFQSLHYLHGYKWHPVTPSRYYVCLHLFFFLFFFFYKMSEGKLNFKSLLETVCLQDFRNNLTTEYIQIKERLCTHYKLGSIYFIEKDTRTILKDNTAPRKTNWQAL